MASSLSSTLGESGLGLGLGEEVHVLAVDDSVVELKLIEKLLQNCDFKVTTAASGLQALEYLGMGEDQNTPESKKMKVNMIITDYCMPGMTGYELLKKIKESSTMKEIPVVIVSSENIPTRIDKCLKEGAHDFILKPVKQSDVKKLKSYISEFTKSCGASSSVPPNKAKMESLPSDQEFQEAICRAP